MSLTQKR